MDTSVFGGALDEEFSVPSRAFLARVERGECHALISRLTHDELERAPRPVQDVLSALPTAHVEDVEVGPEMTALAEAYLDAQVVGPASRYDALHVAAATVAKADVLVSWNFRHIVNYDRMRRFNAVNLMCGYPTLDIRSPREMGVIDED